jgi:hypothetical protein
MQPGYENLVRGRSGIERERSKEMERDGREEVVGLLRKKSSKLLESYKTGQYLQNEI